MAVERVHTYCPMCVSRCGVIATVEDGVFKRVDADPGHPNGCICVKGTANPQLVYSPDRLRYPMKRTRPKGDPDPGWVRISWDKALALAAARLLEIKQQHGAEAVAFTRPAPYGSASSDFTGWYARLINAFGSPNFMANSHICQWHKDQGSIYTYGTGIPAPDFEQTRCILLWGHNPHVSWASHSLRISRAKRRGAKIIVIDPHKAGVANKADLWLRVRPGSDGALALGMIHVLLEEGLYDDAFVREWTNGPFLVRTDTEQLLTLGDLGGTGSEETYLVWDTAGEGLVGYRPAAGYELPGVEPALRGRYRVRLASGQEVECRPAFELLVELAEHYAPEQSEGVTWVPASAVREAVQLFAGEKPSCYYSLVGVEQHTNAMQTNRAICLFYALTGQYDSPGSNVLFAKTPVNPIHGHELLPRTQFVRRLGYPERPLGEASNPGYAAPYDVYRAILEQKPYAVRAMVMFGGNPLLSGADSLRGRAALERLDFYLHVDLFMNPSAEFADVVLPAASCWECEAVKSTFEMGESTTSWAQVRKAVISPLHESRPDIDIVFDLAERLGLADKFWDGDIEAGFNHHLAPSGLTADILRASPAGIRVPVATRYRKYAEVDDKAGQARGFHTPSKKVEVYAIPFARHGYPPLPVYREPAIGPYSRPGLAQEYPLILSMAKVNHFCNTQQRQIPMLRKQVPRPYVEIHPETAGNLGIRAGDWVIVETPTNRVKVTARLNSSLDPRVVCTQHGWWQACPELGLPAYDPFGPEGANANLLVPNDDIDPISGSVPHRSYLCRVSKVADPTEPIGEKAALVSVGA